MPDKQATPLPAWCGSVALLCETAREAASLLREFYRDDPMLPASVRRVVERLESLASKVERC